MAMPPRRDDSYQTDRHPGSLPSPGMMPPACQGAHHRAVGSSKQFRNPSDAPATSQEPISLLDVGVGASNLAAATAGAVGRRVRTIGWPVADALLRPPMLSPRYQPNTWLTGLARRGGKRRDELKRELTAVLDSIVPTVVAAVLQRIDLTETVKRYVDLDSIVAEVDLDAAAVRLDLDALLGRLDLSKIVKERVDLDALVAEVDLDAAAVRLDLDALLGRLDLTKIVKERVDLDALVAEVDLDAAAVRLDLYALIDRIDLVGLTEGVIAEVDLPEIIRESTSSVASDTVRGVRMQGISGDEALGRVVGRLRLRRSPRAAAAPSVDGSAPVGSDVIPRQSGPGATRAP
jgi:hypothetical protein